MTIDRSNDASLARNTSLVSLVFIFVVVFTAAWMLTFVWLNRATIVNLFYQSSLEKYNIATGKVGPATFYVYHEDFSALEKISHEYADIMGVERTKRSGVAAMAFVSEEADAISIVQTAPGVSAMVRRNIPMVCH